MAPTTLSVLVTGAAGGLGKVIAAAYLAKGASVTICDVNKERLSACEAEWNAAFPGKFLAVETDITDEASVRALFDAAAAKFGRLDILVNNAAVMDDFSPVGDCSTDMWRKVLGVNLDGTYFACKAAVAQFERQEPSGGGVINISSVAATKGLHAGVAYGVSKAGVVALTKNMAGYYGPRGISCVALLLGGLAQTNITDAFQRGIHMGMYARFETSHTKFVPEEHAVSLESVAKYCVFLSEPDIAPQANGSVIEFTRNWPEA